MTDLGAILADLVRRTGAPGPPRAIVLERGGAVGILAFGGGGDAPSAFIKVTSEPRRAEAFRREFDNLVRLERTGNADVQRSVPRPLYFTAESTTTVMAQTAVTGVRIKDLPPGRYFRSTTFPRHLSRVVRWLAEFHRSLGDGGSDGGDETTAGAELETFCSAYRVSSPLRALLQDTESQLGGRTFPRTPWHGDFCSANVLVRGDDHLFVVDWEYALRRSWPLSDLLYFLSSVWCTPYRKGRQALAANYRTLFFSEHRLAGPLRQAAGWYMNALGIPADCVLPLTVMTWVAYANRKRPGPGPGDPGVEHEPLTLVEDGYCLNLEILAEHRSRYILMDSSS